ncbi:MAG: DNA cytosine methyltransferase, partial [Hoeflea sp.]|uniref:DNA cytosine methyltransferase n=1 Tax=Hoeflea sp. TaxID=1940281 RepID=UPI00272EF644
LHHVDGRDLDNMQDAVNTYHQNLGDHVHQRDLSNVLDVIPEIIKHSPDMIAGGPPCQDYSGVGKREEGKNARLTLAFAIMIAAARPEWFLMENVIRAASSKAWAEAEAVLKKAGYGISQSKVNFAHYGVPQARRRLIIIGRLGERDGFLESSIAEAASQIPLSVRKALSQKTGHFPSADNRWRPAYAQLISKAHVYTRPQYAGSAVRTVDEPYATVIRTSGEAPSKHFRENYKVHRRDSAPLECASILDLDLFSKIQGFPYEWKWHTNNKQHAMVMIANAVPPPAAEIIGRVILARQAGRTSPKMEGQFGQWLVRGNIRKSTTARNIKSDLRRARYLLEGRTFSNASLEIEALEGSPDFGRMKTGRKSDHRQALHHYREFLDTRGRGRKAAGPVNCVHSPSRSRLLGKFDLKTAMAGMDSSTFQSGAPDYPSHWLTTDT